MGFGVRTSMHGLDRESARRRFSEPASERYAAFQATLGTLGILGSFTPSDALER